MERLYESEGYEAGSNVLRFAGLLRADSQKTAPAARAGGMERFYESEGYEAGSNVLRMVGYFALVGLLRVHLFTPKLAGARPASNCPGPAPGRAPAGPGGSRSALAA